MTDPIDTAALRARYNGSGVARRCQKEQDVIFDDIMALCDALDAARLKSANREKLVRDAYNFAERMLPVVEAARAWYANESGDGQEYFRVTSDLCAAVAAYEAQQEKPVDHMLEAAKIYGSELAGRPDAPFVVQPSNLRRRLATLCLRLSRKRWKKYATIAPPSAVCKWRTPACARH
jgi:hypothetical protein